ncbi:MAG TPA: ABC transporter ATP-binding protein [Clostridiaceae bacterium]|nr:ABC transporter ATP-binding protein [Clostridiaceae bacterium]
MRNLKLLINFMKGSIYLYIGAVVSVCFAAFFTTAIPLAMKALIDSVIGEEPLELPLWVLKIIDKIGGREVLAANLPAVCAIIVVLTAGQGIFLYLKVKLAAVASENSSKRIREKIYDHIMHLPYDYHVKAQTGDLIQRSTSDVETVRNFVSGQLIEIIQILVSCVYILIMMLSLDSLYTAVSIIMVPVVLVFTVKFFTSMKKVFKLTDEAEGSMSTTLQENLTGVRVVKAFGAQSFEIEKFDQKSREYRDLIMKIIRLMAAFWSNSDLLCMTQYGIVLLAGVYMTISDTITLGTMVAFTTLSGMLIWPIRQLGQFLAFMGQAFVALARIQEILDEPVEPDGQDEYEPEIKGEIEFNNVYFEYEEGKPVLDNVSFRIRRGQTAAILGVTGSGKSSLVHLLLRLYDYQGGTIKIDGVELKKINRKWLRRNIGIALQEPFLFSKTIKENIAIGKPNTPDSEIFSAASMACIHNTIQNFEKGYDTLVGERGVTLSGGQRQRLSIARTIIRDVPILIFDDSLSAVDMETDAAIRKALRERRKNVTTIIISHRITTLAEADVIFVLDKGKITQSGTHEELIKQDGLYRRVWLIQNSLEEELAGIV